MFTLIAFVILFLMIIYQSDRISRIEKVLKTIAEAGGTN